MKKSKLILGLMTAMLSFSACSDDSPSNKDVDEPNNGNTTEKYVIAVKSSAPSDKDKADYLLTVDDITKGSTTIVGNGIEQDGTFRYYLTLNNKFFSHKYGRSATGAMAVYELDENAELKKVSDVPIETSQTFGPVKDDILMLQLSRDIKAPDGSWLRFNADKLQIVGNGTFDTKKIGKDLGHGDEIAFFHYPKQFGNKVLLPTPTITAKGQFFERMDTKYPDVADVSVYSYPEMKLEKIIHDDRLSAIGAYACDAISVDEKGDAYAFSPSIRTWNKEVVSKKPCAIVRILKSSVDFDPNYYFNLEDIIGKDYYMTHQIYAKNGKALGFFRKRGGKIDVFSSGEKLGIVDLYNKTITWVKGVPSEDVATNIIAMQSYVSDDKNTVNVGITNKSNGESYVYNIDVNSATANKGLKVEGGSITGIKKLTVKK